MSPSGMEGLDLTPSAASSCCSPQDALVSWLGQLGCKSLQDFNSLALNIWLQKDEEA